MLLPKLMNMFTCCSVTAMKHVRVAAKAVAWATAPESAGTVRANQWRMQWWAQFTTAFSLKASNLDYNIFFS